MPTFGSFCEPVSALSHLLAAVVAILAAPFLLRRARGDTGSMVSIGIYTFCLVFLLAMSGTYHTQFHSTEGRAFFQRLDHAGIWLLIAGCFTPPHVMLFRGRWRWLILLVVWVVAAVGMVFKLALPIDVLPRWLNVSLYIGVSLIGVASVIQLIRHHGVRLVWLLFVCGGVYIGGAACYLFRGPVVYAGVVGYHELWHLAVVAGATCHWIWVFRITGSRSTLAIELPLPQPALQPTLQPALQPVDNRP